MKESSRSLLDLVLSRGSDAMSFLALESGMRHWYDAPAPEGTGACVAFVDVGAWVAACGPLVGEGERARAAARFVRAARDQGRRACFFATESLESTGMSRLLLGEQPVFHRDTWLRGLHRQRRLREQLRRASAKGVRVRRVEAPELREGAPLRGEIERLADDWLRSRHIEPMSFLVSVEPFHHPEEHRYFIAEHRGRVVAFLSAVPIGPRRGWLVEDVFRHGHAPNGTTESLVHALMRGVADGEYVTLGLTPLSGPVVWPLRAMRWLTRPLFDFAGLRAFRERMHPATWQPVWLVYPRSQLAAVTLLDGLRAFARGSLVAFAARSFLRHPSGLPWTLALPLPLWTAGLAWLVASHRAWVLGFPPFELGLWVAFDVLLLLVLVRVAMRPRRAGLVAATSLAVIDAALSIGHFVWVGPGSTVLQASLRTTATIAPAIGSLLLAWATAQATM